jgi:cation transporter-like permease
MTKPAPVHFTSNLQSAVRARTSSTIHTGIEAILYEDHLNLDPRVASTRVHLRPWSVIRGLRLLATLVEVV